MANGWCVNVSKIFVKGISSKCHVTFKNGNVNVLELLNGFRQKF